MYSLARFSLREMIECSAALRRLGRESSTLREAADRVVRYLFAHLGDAATGRRDCVLVRCFKTCSYQSLDPDTQALAREKIGDMTPDPDTKCFTLIASAGVQPEWNRVENSRRYRAIPLVSPAFVRQLPMFSQLLHQFGVSLETAVSPERDFLVDLEETTYNVFFVPTAAGSPYVPVQEEFVRKHGIESVLCFGGLLSPKDLFAVILFSRIPIDRETANLCKSLALGVKVSPPSSDAAKRWVHCRVSSKALRRSAQETPTTPAALTATAGSMWFRPFCLSTGAWSSLIVIGGVHVAPLSFDEEKRISQRPERRSGQVT